ncbi:MAG: hypothetical protein ABIY51_15115 [Ferruginibacter sp.]
MHFQKRIFIIIPIIAVAFGLFSCNGKKKSNEFPNSEMYDFAKPKVVNLPEELDEISGIAYYAKDTSVFAIIDEDGTLFKVPLKNPHAFKQWKFDKKRDFEDIVLMDSTFYVLVSNGDIETINFIGDSLQAFKSNFSDEKKNVTEFETLYKLPDSNLLIMMCKSCDQDDKKSISSISYAYNKDSVGLYNIYKVLNVQPILEKLGVEKHLKPSAGAINPVNGDFYLVSSIQKLIAVFAHDGTLKELYKLDPALYKQPEGITFTPEGDLIISNESAQDGFATLLLMKNKKKKADK